MLEYETRKYSMEFKFAKQFVAMTSSFEMLHCFLNSVEKKFLSYSYTYSRFF